VREESGEILKMKERREERRKRERRKE